MTVLYVMILAILQGITEFIPASSYGHLAAVQQYLGMDLQTGALLESMLHLGTAAAIIFAFKKDLKKIGTELLGMFMDLVGNINLYIHNRRTGESLNYAKIVSGTYRRFTALLLVSMIPTAVLGLVCRRLVGLAAASPIMPGIGFLVTGIVLLVTDFSNSGGDKGPRDADWGSAVWIGICQGLAVFPGVSRMGLTLCAALMCGYSRKFAVKFSILMSFPALIGAFFTQLGFFASEGMTLGLTFACILGAVLAGVTGCLVIRTAQRLAQKKKLRWFAVYSFLAGLIALGGSFL